MVQSSSAPAASRKEAIGEGLDRIGHGLDDATLRRGANSEPPAVTDGPFAEAKELFNGFWILDVASKDEAKQWGLQCPVGTGVKLEVRRVGEIEEFDMDNEWIQKELQWRKENDPRCLKK